MNDMRTTSTANPAVGASQTAQFDAFYKRINHDLHDMNNGLGKFVQDEIAKATAAEHRLILADLQRLSHSFQDVLRDELDARGLLPKSVGPHGGKEA